MDELSQCLILGFLGTILGNASVLFTLFTLWICSLRVDLDVYAPLVDGPRARRPHP